MFNYREFIMTGFKSAIGKMADYQIIFNANGFFEKGVLTEDDLAEISNLIDTKNAMQIIDETVQDEIVPENEEIISEEDAVINEIPETEGETPAEPDVEESCDIPTDEETPAETEV